MIHVIHKIAKSRFCENPDFRLYLTPLRVVGPVWGFKIVYDDISALEHAYAFKIRL